MCDMSRNTTVMARRRRGKHDEERTGWRGVASKSPTQEYNEYQTQAVAVMVLESIVTAAVIARARPLSLASVSMLIAV